MNDIAKELNIRHLWKNLATNEARCLATARTDAEKIFARSYPLTKLYRTTTKRNVSLENVYLFAVRFYNFWEVLRTILAKVFLN